MRNEDIHAKVVAAPLEKSMRKTTYDGLVLCVISLKMHQFKECSLTT